MTPELAGTIAPQLDAHARAESVTGVLFTRAVVVDARHALLTFAVTSALVRGI